VAELVLEALRAMRPPFAFYEADLHRLIGDRLVECGFTFQHEAKLGNGCRIDYLIGDVGVEIKRGKPVMSTLRGQIARYAQSERIAGLIVVTWQSVRLPASIGGKPVYPLALAKLWGVSLP
jgi:hypothetical protein